MPDDKKNESIDVRDKYGETMLIRESRRGDSTLVRSLIERGADVNATDNDGRNALIYSSSYNYPSIVKLLLDRGVNINACDTNGETAIICASFAGHVDVVRKLIESGANLNAAKKDGTTSLMAATFHNHTAIVRLLLEGGVNVNAADEHGETALMIAVRKMYNDIIKLLIDAGANVNAADNEGMTALMKASQMSKTDNRFSVLAKSLNKHLQISLVQKDILQGRCQIYTQLLDTGNKPVRISEEYIAECTNNFANDYKIGPGGIAEKGLFGTVYYGEDKENQMLKYVIKKTVLALISNEVVPNVHEIFQSKISALSRIRHPNMARLYGYSIKDHGGDKLIFAYEYCTNGTLRHKLATDERRALLAANLRVKILYEVARAIHFLHKGVVSSDGTSRCQFFHRDIKASNIFLESNFTAKLMDCGLSTLIDDSDASTNPSTESSESSSLPKKKLLFEKIGETNVFGTPGYICPAYLSGSIPYDFACDIYSFGVVMLEILTGWLQTGQCQNHSSDQDLVQKYQDKSTLLENIDKLAGDGWFHILDDLCDLALSCVASDPKARPPIGDVLESVSNVYTRLILSPNSTPVSSPSK